MAKITLGTKEWGVTKIPQVGAGKKAFILNGAFYGASVEFFAEAGYSRAGSVEDADVVVFIGGVDVDPALYDQDRRPETQTPDLKRDSAEYEAFEKAKALGIPMFGICRGAQFLHVMNGGELWQDVNNHAGPDHWIVDLEDDVRVRVTSLHHQMIKDNGKIDILAVTEDQVATRFKDANMQVFLDRLGANASTELEIEAGCYYDPPCFFVQGHPEVGEDAYRAWTFHRWEAFLEDVESIKADSDIEIAERNVV